jgi:hypothetical protein
VIGLGDGTTSAGTLTAAGGEGFANVSVSGQHVYARPGSFGIYVDVTDDQTKQVIHHAAHIVASIAVAGVAPEAPLAPAPPEGETGKPTAPRGGPAASARLGARRFVAYRGVPRSGVVALLWSPLPRERLRAVIHWGDGTVGRGRVAGPRGALRVHGRHRWRRAGRYEVAVGVTDAQGRFLAKTVSEVTVRSGLTKRWKRMRACR